MEKTDKFLFDVGLKGSWLEYIYKTEEKNIFEDEKESVVLMPTRTPRLILSDFTITGKKAVKNSLIFLSLYSIHHGLSTAVETLKLIANSFCMREIRVNPAELIINGTRIQKWYEMSPMAMGMAIENAKHGKCLLVPGKRYPFEKLKYIGLSSNFPGGKVYYNGKRKITYYRGHYITHPYTIEKMGSKYILIENGDRRRIIGKYMNALISRVVNPEKAAEKAEMSNGWTIIDIKKDLIAYMKKFGGYTVFKTESLNESVHYDVITRDARVIYSTSESFEPSIANIRKIFQS